MTFISLQSDKIGSDSWEQRYARIFQEDEKVKKKTSVCYFKTTTQSSEDVRLFCFQAEK